MLAWQWCVLPIAILLFIVIHCCCFPFAPVVKQLNQLAQSTQLQHSKVTSCLFRLRYIINGFLLVLYVCDIYQCLLFVHVKKKKKHPERSKLAANISQQRRQASSVGYFLNFQVHIHALYHPFGYCDACYTVISATRHLTNVSQSVSNILGYKWIAS